jgi:hypothetical protein
MSNVICEKFLWRCSCGVRMKNLTDNLECKCENLTDQKRHWMSETTCNLIDDMKRKIQVLETALWHFGNHNGPDVIEELKSLLPENILNELDLISIEKTKGDS